jgi:hypothetical protein
MLLLMMIITKKDTGIEGDLKEFMMITMTMIVTAI